MECLETADSGYFKPINPDSIVRACYTCIAEVLKSGNPLTAVGVCICVAYESLFSGFLGLSVALTAL
jgi:hypothetical protein